MNYITNKIRDKNNIRLIKNSTLFDEKYYKSQSNCIKGSAAKHYYYKGYKEGLSPSYNFSNNFYLNNNPDVKNSNINPLIHYIKYGKNENRLIRKDDGISFTELYYTKYIDLCNFRLFYNDSQKKRLNLFVKSFNEEDCILIKNINNYCQNNNLILRIIYNCQGLNSLKNYIQIDEAIESIFLKKNNYIITGMEDIFVSLSYKFVFSLLNNSILYNKVYYFLEEQPKLLDEIYNYSKVVFNRS